MADEATNEASAPAVDQAASQSTAQATVADNAVAGEPADAVGQAQPSESVAPTHEEVAFSDRATMLFEELVRHIKSEETALVGGVDAILSELVAKVRG